MFRTLLIAGILISFLLLPGYLHFSALKELDIVTPYTCFKSIDQEYSIAGWEKKEKTLGLIFVIKHILETNLFIKQFPSFSSKIFSLESKSLILRC